VPERLFLFLQLEFPWELGPPDGRYLLRTRDATVPAEDVAAPERVIVLGTLGASRRVGSGLAAIGLPRVGSARRARRPRETTPDAAPVLTARATIVDPVSVSAERQAETWLQEIDAERETLAATAVLNRVLYAHRIAAADPYTHEVTPAQALVIRAGWGEGEQVADGDWRHARELPWVASSRAKRRAAALRPQERLCEEFALRARLDLDQGRLTHAAHELDAALSAAEEELGEEANPALAPRVDELRALHAGIGEEADEEQVRHALERLEAALRARTAGGFSRS
jgi:hypothetical protein